MKKFFICPLQFIGLYIVESENPVFTELRCTAGGAVFPRRQNLLQDDSITRSDPRIRGTILHDNRKRYTKAIHWYQKALEANPEFVPAWFFMANAVYEKGDKQKSIECYLKVISLDPTNFWACNNVGSVYEELNRNTEALRYFRKALEIMPGQHKALFNIGVVLSKWVTNEGAGKLLRVDRGYNRYPYSF